MHRSSASRPRRRTVALTAATALVLSVAPLGAVAAQAAPTAAVSAATTRGLHVVRTDHLKGTEGSLTYDVAIPVFAGSGAAVTVNRRVRSSAWTTIRATAKETLGGDRVHHTLGGSGRVTTNDGRTVQVVTEYADYFDRAAHPTDTVATVALVARTGAPIVLSDVFKHQRSAFTVLGREVERIAARQDEPVTDRSGLAPRAANWTAWQTTRTGFQVHFQDYQLGGHGLRVYTVPWRTVAPLLSAEARTLLAPRR
ncbi:hypothetical protein [uncultured Amnibacterium sp.]|uniref:hypothetical protein n=1 Tax=uncultured Amnibacterium sp. TaxID=1631851 RepID=UPI0035C99110